MVLKKCFFLLVSAWLINTMVCFHGVDLFGNDGVTIPLKQRITAQAPHSLLSWLTGHSLEKDDSDLGQPVKIKYRYRYVAAQQQLLAVYWQPVVKTDWAPDYLPSIIRTYFGRSKARVFADAFAVPLFRLTPF